MTDIKELKDEELDKITKDDETKEKLRQYQKNKQDEC